MRTTRAMSPGEIAAGQFITILEAIEEKPESFGDAEIVLMQDPRARRSSLTGVPLKVLAVDLPFVLAQVESPGGDKFSLDTRLHRLMELKPEFVQAFTAEPPERHPQFAQLATAHNNLSVIMQQHVLPTLQRLDQPAPPPKPWWRRWL